MTCYRIFQKLNSECLRARSKIHHFLADLLIDFEKQFYNPLNLITDEWTLVAGQDSS